MFAFKYLITKSVLPFRHLSKANKGVEGWGGGGGGEIGKIANYSLSIKNSSNVECFLSW